MKKRKKDRADAVQKIMDTQKGGRSCGLLFVKGVFKREMNYLEMS